MLHIEKPGISCMFGDSAWEVVNFLRSPSSVAVYPSFLSRVQSGGYDWSTGALGCSYEQALRLVIEGWDEGVQLMHHGLQTLIGVNASGISRWKADVAGEQPDIYRALGGDPRDMRRRAFSQGGKPIIHIVVNTAMQAGATDVQTRNYGIAILGLIDYLESRGKRVELDRLGVVNGRNGYGTGPSTSGRSLQGWKVKSASEAPDLSVIAFSIAHPASHRKLVWAMRSHCKAVEPAGSAARITKEDAALIGAEHAFLLDSVGQDGAKCETPQSALILAGERLNKAAGEELVDISELRL